MDNVGSKTSITKWSEHRPTPEIDQTKPKLCCLHFQILSWSARLWRAGPVELSRVSLNVLISKTTRMLDLTCKQTRLDLWDIDLESIPSQPQPSDWHLKEENN